MPVPFVEKYVNNRFGSCGIPVNFKYKFIYTNHPTSGSVSPTSYHQPFGMLVKKIKILCGIYADVIKVTSTGVKS